MTLLQMVTDILSDLEADIPAWTVARRYGLRGYHVVLWRKVLTFESRRLLPELAPLKATSPLLLVHPAPEVQEIESAA